jgi:hypothetical protein
LDVLHKNRLERMITDTIVLLDLLQQSLSICTNSIFTTNQCPGRGYAEVVKEADNLLTIFSHDE